MVREITAAELHTGAEGEGDHGGGVTYRGGR